MLGGSFQKHRYPQSNLLEDQALSIEPQARLVERAQRDMLAESAYLVSVKPGEPPCTGSRSACPKSMTLKRRGPCCCSMI